MKAAPFEYAAPTRLDEALTLLRSHGPEARPIAGGQSLVPMLALRLARPGVLVDLNRIAELAYIREHAGGLAIGAMTRQAAILTSSRVATHAALLAKALAEVGHPPTRARGTIGGSLAHADPAAELPVAMLALEATMVARGPDGERRIAAADFFTGMFETALAPGELLTGIEIPSTADAGAGFCEIAQRKGDFAIVAAGACVRVDAEGVCRDARLALGSVGPVPIRCPEVESELLGRRLDDAAIARAAAALDATRIEADSLNAGVAYRRRVAPVLARRALSAAREAAKGAGR